MENADAGRPALVFSPHPILLGRDQELVYAWFLPNETILEYLRRTGLLERMARQPFVLTVDGRRLPRTLWARCRPKPGTLINVYAVVKGGDGKKNPIATIAMIALTVYAPGWGQALAGATGVGTAAVWSAGLMVVGGLVINSIFPPPRPDLARAQNLGGSDSPNYAIAGGSNRMRRYEPMVKIIGVHRVFPDFGAQPYTEFEGNDQVGYYVFDFGYNDCELTGFKIGDTPIGEYEGVEMEISGADGELALFPGNVDSVAGVELTAGLGFVSRTSSPSARSLAVEITGALFYLGDSGTEQRAAEIDLEYRAVGAGAWTALQFAPDTVPATSIVQGVARMPAAQYTRGARKEIDAQPANMPGLTVLSASVNTPAGTGFLTWTSKNGGAWRWTPPGGSAGAFVVVREAGSYFLRDATGTMDVFVSFTSPTPSVDGVFTDTHGSFTHGADEIPGRFLMLNASREPLRRTLKWHVAEGQYEVRVKKSSPDETNLRATAQIVWSQLRTYQPDAADYTGRLRVGMKVRASALANGVLQQLSCIARARTTVWGGGSALEFNGDQPVGLNETNPHHVEIPAAAILRPTTQWSVAGWVRPDALPQTDNGAGIFDYGGNNKISVQVINSGVRVNVGGVWGALDVAFATGAGIYAHVVTTYDNSSAAGVLKLYFNGTEVGSTNGIAEPVAHALTAFIGRRKDHLQHTLKGALKGIRLYSRALSTTEAADHYRGRFDDETGLVGRWDFDEGMGTVANDSSGNGNHGTLVNGPAWIAGDPAVPRANVHTSNPSWWVLDAHRGKTINARRVYGGGLADARIDIEGLKAFAAWCDAEGLEFNGVFDQQVSLFELVSALALMGRGSPTMQTGKHGVLWDAPDLPATALFGMHNIVAGSFEVEYATGDLADVIEVWFINPDLGWQRDFVRALVPGAQSQARVRRVEGFGCTTKAQAQEIANLYAAQQTYRARRYKWRSDWEQMPCARGDVALIGHDLLQLRSGRFIEGGDASTLKLPRKVTLFATGGFVTIRKPDQTFATYAVDGGAGETDTLTLPTPLPFNPWADPDGLPPYDYRWHYGPAATTGRLVKIELFKPVSERYVDVAAVDEDPAYYAAKDAPAAPLPAPGVFGQVQLQALNVTEDGVRAGTGYLARVLVSWDVLGDYGFADVRVSVNGGPVEALGVTVRGRSFTFNVQDFSDVVVEVTAWSSFGRHGKSSKLTVEHHVNYAGQSVPSDPREFFLDGHTFRWLRAPEVDVVGSRIRFHYGENQSFADANELHAGLLASSPTTFEVLPSGTVTFFCTDVDAAGLESASQAIIVRNLGDPELANVVERVDFEALSFPGTLTGGTEVGDDLEANGTTAFYGSDAATFYGADVDPFYEDEVYEEMVYTTEIFYFSVDWIGSAMTLEHALEGLGVFVEFRQTNDGDFYGADGDDFYGADGESFYGADGEWRPWPGTVSYAGGDVQLRITTAAGPKQGAVRELAMVIDVPDVVEELENVSIPQGGARLALTKDFDHIKTVQLTLQDDDGAAVSARYLDKDPVLGPLVECIDETKASVTGILDATITGR